MAFYGVVGGVDLGGDALGPGALVGVGVAVGVEALDQLAALPVNLLHRGAGAEAEPVVCGEDAGRIPPGDKGGGRAAPPGGPALLVAWPLGLSRGRPFGAALLGPAPLFRSAFPGGLEGASEDLAALAADAKPLAEAFVLLQVGDETLGETSQGTGDALCPWLPLVFQ